MKVTAVVAVLAVLGISAVPAAPISPKVDVPREVYIAPKDTAGLVHIRIPHSGFKRTPNVDVYTTTKEVKVEDLRIDDDLIRFNLRYTAKLGRNFQVVVQGHDGEIGTASTHYDCEPFTVKRR